MADASGEPAVRLPDGVRVYAVGGSVRDALLGLPDSDRDWVVVGAQAQQMIEAGFRPVGQDFPVFLHPHTHEEYALARTERKTAPGYRGFVFHASPEVTLEDDLARRDLTINAMARDARGALIDPFGGHGDLARGVLRHVSDAFAEDPVRILRVARFAARFTAFTVAPETVALMRAMVDAGEVDALVPERVWQELSRGLMEREPSRMFAVLRDCGALARLLPELDRLWGVPQRAEYHPEIDTGVHAMMVIDDAARHDEPLDVRWAALVHDLGKGTTPVDLLPRHHGHEARSVALAEAVAQRFRVPNEPRALATLVAREHGVVHRADELRPGTVLELIERCDGLRKPDRFARMLAACACDYRGRAGWQDREYLQAERFAQALAAARGIDAGAVAREVAAGGLPAADAIRAAVHAARLGAVAQALAEPADEADAVPGATGPAGNA